MTTWRSPVVSIFVLYGYLLFVIEKKNGRFKVGDVLTEHYINKIRLNKKRKKAAHQYNRRTSFKVLREDYVPVTPEVAGEENK